MTTTYSNARERFAELMELAIADREIIEITRRGYEPVALVAMSELRSLLETAHLLRSPKNAERLLRAIERVRQGDQGITMSLDELRVRMGLSKEELAHINDEYDDTTTSA